LSDQVIFNTGKLASVISHPAAFAVTQSCLIILLMLSCKLRSGAYPGEKFLNTKKKKHDSQSRPIRGQYS